MITACQQGKIPVQKSKIGPASGSSGAADIKTLGVSMSKQTIQPGYCQCGCGEYIGFWKYANRSRGLLAGDPKKYVPGHNNRGKKMPRRSQAERFWPKVNKDTESGCWEWVAGRDSSGYGSFYTFEIEGRRKTVGAHRWSYEALVGPIPEGLTLDHLCRNRACVNPAHLEPVTATENTHRGKSFSAVNLRKTHCPQGHEYNEENTKWYEGRRYCRPCARMHGRNYMRRIRREARS